MLSRRFATVVTLVIVVAFVVVAVAPAFASAPASAPATAPASLVLHARLASSAPEDGATVETADEVVLTFNEDVNPDFVAVRVSGPQGSEVAGRPTVEGTTVTQALSPGLPAGEHAVTFRVVSADGHPVAGSLAFTTTASPASDSPSTSASASPTASATASTPPVASPQPSPSAAPASAEPSGVSPVLVTAALGVLALVAVAVGWRVRGRRGSPPPA